MAECRWKSRQHCPIKSKPQLVFRWHSVIKRKRTYNVRLIKATWPYTVQEIAKLFNVHKGAVLRWIKEGLHADKIKGEYLIRGDRLALFLSTRQQKKKHTCAINEFFCFKCREPRTAYLNIADVEIITPTRFRVRSLCSVCSTPVNKVQGIRNLSTIQNSFVVQHLEGQHIIECSEPSLNSDLEVFT